MFGDDDLRAEEGAMTAVRESFIRHAITFPGFVGDRDLFFHATRDAMREVDRLRAEVERLTKEKARACQMAFEEGAIWGYTGPTGAAIQAEAELRYPLPTPEAK